MLPKKYRLKNSRAFEGTYKNKYVISDSTITIYVGKAKKDKELPTKYGFVVSKKFHKRAVKRNRIKRLLRECIRLGIKNQKLSKLDNYMSFILIPKAKALDTNLKTIEQSFYNLLEKIK